MSYIWNNYYRPSFSISLFNTDLYVPCKESGENLDGDHLVEIDAEAVSRDVFDSLSEWTE